MNGDNYINDLKKEESLQLIHILIFGRLGWKPTGKGIIFNLNSG